MGVNEDIISEFGLFLKTEFIGVSKACNQKRKNFRVNLKNLVSGEKYNRNFS